MAGSVITIRALDGILKRYGNQLKSLGQKQAVKVMARALNYEGRRVYTLIKREVAKQSSIPYGQVSAGTKFKSSSTAMSSSLTASITAVGSYLTLPPFKPRQLKSGVSATVWHKRQRYKRSFGAPGDKPGVVAALGGIPYHRAGKARLPIKPLFGANIAVELVRDAPPQIFQAAQSFIVARIEKEIAAVLRGY
jgi:hypothetical protein